MSDPWQWDGGKEAGKAAVGSLPQRWGQDWGTAIGGEEGEWKISWPAL